MTKLVKRAAVASAQPVDPPKRPPRRKGAAGGGRPNKADKIRIAAAAVVVIGVLVLVLGWLDELDGSSPIAPENSRTARRPPPPPPPPTAAPVNERRDRSESVVSYSKYLYGTRGRCWA